MTAANADKWIPVRPGWEGYLALSIAHVIVSKNLQASNVDVDALLGGETGREILNAFRPEAVVQLVGITPEVAGGDPVEFIEKLATDFATHGPSIAIAGGSAGAHSNGLFNVQAASVLNWLVGSVGAKGGVTLNPAGPWDGVPSSAAASSIDEYLKNWQNRFGLARFECCCCTMPIQYTDCRLYQIQRRNRERR